MQQSKCLKKVLHDTSTDKFYVDSGVELDLQEYEERLAEQSDDVQVMIYYLRK